MPSLKLNVHLFREDIKTLDQVQLRDPKEGQARYHEYHPSPPLPFPARLWVVPSSPKAPRWRNLLDQRFKVADDLIMNQWTGALVLVEVQQRVFAVAFGFGGNALPREFMEPDFGLHVLGNCLLQDKIKAIETRSIERNTRQAAIQVTNDSPIHQFEINTHTDWVRKLSGRSTDAVVGGRVDGADTVKLSYSGELADLDKVCVRLLELLGCDDYKTRFPFIEHWRLVKDTAPVKSRLEARLQELIAQRDTSLITLAHPDLPRDTMSAVRIHGGRKQMTFEELNVYNLYSFLKSYPMVRVDQVHVDELDEDHKWIGGDKLRNYLVAEISLDDSVYVLSCNRWFKIEADYVKDVHARVAALEDVTSTLSLPIWERDKHVASKSEDEDIYNKRVANTRGYQLLDKAMFTFGRPVDKIEAADLLTPDQDFLCVKKMRDSATLSHLWAQASVSATLLNADKAYGDEMAKIYRRKFGKDYTRKQGRFVYAVGTDKVGLLADSLFFFAKVNLLLHVDRIRACGYDVALCHIEKPVNRIMPAPKPKSARNGP